jgi:hypothetical protein
MSELVTGLLRSLADLARQTPGVRPDVQPCSEIAFELGRSHPLYDLLGERAPRYDPPYAWYIRVPDIRAFLRLIGRVLEQRLAASALAGYTGRPKFDLYRDGFQLQFEQGTLAAVEQWRAQAKDDSDAALQCPPLTFLQLLMSYRSVGELSDFFPDVAAVGENRLLVDTLFPRLHSTIEPMG